MWWCALQRGGPLRVRRSFAPPLGGSFARSGGARVAPGGPADGSSGARVLGAVWGWRYVQRPGEVPPRERVFARRRERPRIAPQERSSGSDLRRRARHHPRFFSARGRGRDPPRARAPRGGAPRRDRDPRKAARRPPEARKGRRVRGLQRDPERRSHGRPRSRRRGPRGSCAPATRHVKRALAGLVALVPFGCAHESLRTDTRAACPSPFFADASREARLVTWLAADAEARAAVRELPRVCFGPSDTLGVLVAGRPMLDTNASDAALAGRLAHLGVHFHDGLGDGCDRGLSGALASEERARVVETRVRALGSLAPLPRGDAARADYAARCGLSSGEPSSPSTTPRSPAPR